MRKVLLSFASVALIASPAFAAEEDSGVSSDAKVVCKRVANTGWRLAAAQVCKTAAEWDSKRRRGQRDYDEFGSYGGRSRCLECRSDSQVGQNSGF